MRRLLPILLLTPFLWVARDHTPPLLTPDTACASCKTTTTSSSSTSSTSTSTTSSTSSTEATTSTSTSTSTTTTTLAILAQDRFDRAAPLGDNWTTLGNLAGATIYNTDTAYCTPNACTGSDNVSFWDAASFPSTAAYACTLWQDGTASGDYYFGACITNGDTSTTNEDAICCYINSYSGSPRFGMYKITDGTGSDLIAAASQTWATGDSIAIVRNGTTYQCYRDAAGGAVEWTQLGIDKVDSLFTGITTYPGIYTWGNQTDTAAAALESIDAFEADDTTTLPTGAVCGSN